MKVIPWLPVLAQLFSIFVGIISYKKRSVSITGLIALLLISSLFIWLNKIALLFVLFLMFASSSILSHYKKSEKKEFEAVVAKTGPRDYIQAICNLGVATLLLLLYHFMEEDWILAALIGSVAAANADSWASEIGGLSKRQPIMITTFKPVAKGISGGITLIGTLGGFAGSLFIVASSFIFMNLISPFGGSTKLLFWSAFLSGIAGFLLDSLIGALFQSLYEGNDKIKNTLILTENPQNNKSLVKGVRWINNDVVNLFTTLMGALLAGGLYYGGTFCI